MRNDTTPHTPAEVRERVKGAWATVEAAALAQAARVEEYEWNNDEAAEIRDAVAQVAALLRTPRGEGEAEVVARLNELSYEVRENPLLDAGAVSDELATMADTLAALRSEAQGELTILDRLQQEINEIASDDLLNVVALDALTTLASRMGFDANGSFPIGRHPSLVDASRPGWLTTPTNGGSDVR